MELIEFKELRNFLFDAPDNIKESWNSVINYFDENSGFLMARIKLPDILSNPEEKINPEDLSEKGFENDPHITILAKFPSKVTEKDMKLYLPDIKNLKAKITGISVFHQKDCDVLKYDIDSEDLVTLNKKLKEVFTSNSEYEYSPHSTIAYLKKGTGDKYSVTYDNPIDLELDSYMFSIDYLTSKI